MKRLSYLLVLALMISTICACGGKSDGATAESGTGTENSGNFSSEMIIEPSTDVTIVEMP